MKHHLTIQLLGHQCILIQWEGKDNLQTINNTIEYLKQTHKAKILEMVPAYSELAIYLHEKIDQSNFLIVLQEELPLSSQQAAASKTITYEIPVCYHADKGWDLETMAKSKNISTDKIIELHTQPTYHIHFIGFLPGFPYLSGLNQQLHHPRLKTPRIKISKGAIGIAGHQTGIYPSASPGGWNIIGQTPIDLFSVQVVPPALLQVGNSLRFKAISSSEFEQISEEVKANNYQISMSDD